MIPIEVSLKKSEKVVFTNLQDNRKERNPQFHLVQLFRTVHI